MQVSASHPFARRRFGRNDPCPCGSGRKFKRCHYPILRAHADRIAADPVRLQQHGHVRPVINGLLDGHRFVAVGNELLIGKQGKWRTFPDFLVDYARDRLGSGWGQAEIAKPRAEDRHPIVRWYQHFCEIQSRATRDPDGIYRVDVDGVSTAFIVLAYDLYVLRHHGKLQREVLRRLRLHDQFFGARHELFVAALFVRAGFDIEYEDERDGSRKHPEFVATHRTTKFVMAVEAKAKHRDLKANDPRPKAGVKSLLVNAANKRSVHPYAVFVDMNLPPEPATAPPSWAPEVHGTVDEIVAKQGTSPFDMVFFTNVPHQYGRAGEPDPPKHVYVRKPTRRIPMTIDEALIRAMTQYGNIPNDFPTN
jgi:hypothetical protein